MDLRSRYLLWINILMFFLGFGLVFRVAAIWATSDSERAGTTSDAEWERSLRSADPVAADMSLTSAVQTALQLDPELAGLPLSVTTRARVVHLAGAVADEAQRRRAGLLARGVPGVRAVENRLRTDPAVRRMPPGTPRAGR